MSETYQRDFFAIIIKILLKRYRVQSSKWRAKVRLVVKLWEFCWKVDCRTFTFTPTKVWKYQICNKCRNNFFSVVFYRLRFGRRRDVQQQVLHHGGVGAGGVRSIPDPDGYWNCLLVEKWWVFQVNRWKLVLSSFWKVSWCSDLLSLKCVSFEILCRSNEIISWGFPKVQSALMSCPWNVSSLKYYARASLL